MIFHFFYQLLWLALVFSDHDGSAILFCLSLTHRRPLARGGSDEPPLFSARSIIHVYTTASARNHRKRRVITICVWCSYGFVLATNHGPQAFLLIETNHCPQVSFRSPYRSFVIATTVTSRFTTTLCYAA